MKSDSENFICDFGLIEDEYGNFKELDGMGRIVFPSINLKKVIIDFLFKLKSKNLKNYFETLRLFYKLIYV